MLKINDITLTLQSIANSDTVLLIAVKPIKEFIEGKPTDKIIAYSYTVVCPKNKFVSFDIKIDGYNPLFTNEQITSQGGHIEVSVSDFTGRFFKSKTGDYILTAKASSLEVIAQ